MDQPSRPRPRDARDVSADVAAMREEIKARYPPGDADPARRDVRADVAAMRDEIKARHEALDRDPAARRRDLHRPGPPEPDPPKPADARPAPRDSLNPARGEAGATNTQHATDDSSRSPADPARGPRVGDAHDGHRDRDSTHRSGSAEADAANTNAPTIEGGPDEASDNKTGHEPAKPLRPGKRDEGRLARGTEPGSSHDQVASSDQQTGPENGDQHDPSSMVEQSRDRSSVSTPDQYARAAAKLEAEQRHRDNFREALGGEPLKLGENAQLDARMLIERRSASEAGTGDVQTIARGVWYSSEPGDWGHTESGRWNPDGTPDELSGQVVDKLRALGAPDGLAIDAHVETKLAARMARDNIPYMTVVINRPVCIGRLSCDRLLPMLLPEGAMLRVYEPDGTMRLYKGQAR